MAGAEIDTGCDQIEQVNERLYSMGMRLKLMSELMAASDSGAGLTIELLREPVHALFFDLAEECKSLHKSLASIQLPQGAGRRSAGN